MPHTRITIGRPDLSAELQQTLASTVTDLMAADLLKVREEAVVHLELVEPGRSQLGRKRDQQLAATTS